MVCLDYGERQTGIFGTTPLLHFFGNLLHSPGGCEDGPGMWVLVFDTDSDPWQLEQPPIRVTDGTNILMPEVHLAKVTGVLGDLVQSGSSILVDSATWSKCLPFARFCYTTTLPLPLSTEFLLPQLTDELRTGDLVAMIKQPCP